MSESQEADGKEVHLPREVHRGGRWTAQASGLGPVPLLGFSTLRPRGVLRFELKAFLTFYASCVLPGPEPRFTLTLATPEKLPLGVDSEVEHPLKIFEL